MSKQNVNYYVVLLSQIFAHLQILHYLIEANYHFCSLIALLIFKTFKSNSVGVLLFFKGVSISNFKKDAEKDTFK